MSKIHSALVSYERVLGDHPFLPVTKKPDQFSRLDNLEKYSKNKEAATVDNTAEPTASDFKWYYDGGSKPSATTSSTSMTPIATKGNLAKNAEYAYNYLVKNKIPAASAAGIVGNLYHEDLANPLRTVPDSRGTKAYGIAGFNSKGDLPNLMKWAADNGIQGNPNFDQQLDYITHVITSGRDSNLTSAIMNPNATPEDASFAWGRYFEKFAGRNGRGYLDRNDPEHVKRGSTSRQLFTKYGKSSS